MTTSKPKVAIYALCCPETGDVRYVGKSYHPHERSMEHMRPSSNRGQSPRNVWLRKLIHDETPPTLRLLEWCKEEEWEDRERHWIAEHAGPSLTNSTDGGSGPPMDGRGRNGRTWHDLRGIRHLITTYPTQENEQHGRLIEMAVSIMTQRIGKRNATLWADHVINEWWVAEIEELNL